MTSFNISYDGGNAAADNDNCNSHEGDYCNYGNDTDGDIFWGDDDEHGGESSKKQQTHVTSYVMPQDKTLSAGFRIGTVQEQQQCRQRLTLAADTTRHIVDAWSVRRLRRASCGLARTGLAGGI